MALESWQTMRRNQHSCNGNTGHRNLILYWVFFLCKWVEFRWGYWKSRYVSPQVKEKKSQLKWTLAQYAFCIEFQKSWFGEIPPLLKNTLQSKILQVNKNSIFLLKKRKIIIVLALFQHYVLCVQLYATICVKWTLFIEVTISMQNICVWLCTTSVK